MPRYRIFCLMEERSNLPSTLRVEASYPAFIIATASIEAIEKVRQQFPIEKLKEPKKPPKKPKWLALPKRGPYFYAVRFYEPIRPEWLKEITLMEGQVCKSLGHLTLVVRCSRKSTIDQLRKLPTNSRLFQPPIKIRLTKYIPTLSPTELPSSDQGDVLFASFFTEVEQQRAKQALGRREISNITVINQSDLRIDLTNYSNPPKAVQLIAAQIGLYSLEKIQLFAPCNNKARNLIGAGVIPRKPGSLKLTGEGELVAVADAGLDIDHPDFGGRIKKILPPPESNEDEDPHQDNNLSNLATGHGTHICGSILGDGMIKGMATKAQLVFQPLKFKSSESNDYDLQIPDIISELFQPAYEEEKIRIYCCPWGSNDPAENYTQRSQLLDKFVWDHKDFLIVTAAGNKGEPEPHPDEDRDIVSLKKIVSPGNAKNCLTVGATENNHADDPNVARQTYGRDDPEHRWPDEPFNSDSLVHPNDIFAMSSRGPDSGGRRKPDVVAPGALVLSTRSRQLPDNYIGWAKSEQIPPGYVYLGGTSMATALVTGCAALIRQYLRAYLPEGQKISAALIKGIIIHSAEYVPYQFSRPDSKSVDQSNLWWADYEQGWGRVDLQQVLNPKPPLNVLFLDEMEDEVKGLACGEARLFTFKVTDATHPLRITLVYTDQYGAELINNLNLSAKDPSGKHFVGNDFTGSNTPDSVNNVEKIIIKQPILGRWIITVTGEVMPNQSQNWAGTQDFALIISGGGIKLIERKDIKS